MNSMGMLDDVKQERAAREQADRSAREREQHVRNAADQGLLDAFGPYVPALQQFVSESAWILSCPRPTRESGDLIGCSAGYHGPFAAHAVIASALSPAAHAELNVRLWSYSPRGFWSRLVGKKTMLQTSCRAQPHGDAYGGGYNIQDAWVGVSPDRLVQFLRKVYLQFG
jgi:hypothetical protein